MVFSYISYFDIMSQNFSQKEIQEFKELIQKEYNTNLSDQEILDFMTQTFKLVKNAYSPVNKNEFAEIKRVINNLN